MSLRFIDLFAGAGGIRIAFEQNGFSCVFSSEWDTHAKKSYEANFGERPAGDIREVSADSIPDFEFLTAGFPCQPFSIAGVSKKKSLGRMHGFLDQTQGTLFFDVLRLIRERRPAGFLLENVKNLTGHDGGRTFQIILTALNEAGYSLKHEVISSGSALPQNRKRIFIAGFLDPEVCERFCFPDENKIPPGPYIQEKLNLRNSAGSPVLGDILEKKTDNRYILTDHLWQYLQNYKKKHQKSGNGFGYGLCGINDRTRTLSARYYKDGSEILVKQRKSKKNPNGNPRRLTPRECARIMGFPEDYKIVVSDTQAYRQFGNSVAVPVVAAIAKNIHAAFINVQVRGQAGFQEMVTSGKNKTVKRDRNQSRADRVA